MADMDKPHEDDLRVDDESYDVTVEPNSAKAWLNLLEESETAFEPWNNHCDNLDKMYASLERLSSATPIGAARQKEFQMFWANCEVLKPSIYAKPPVPVVVPKFKDRRPMYQAASEVMERCCVVAFDLTRINDLMLLVRDDLSMTSRGVAWCRYEGGGGNGYYDHEKVCIDFKGRRDFLHSISRNWREVTWVAGASYLTRSEARKRFYDISGDAYQQAEYEVDKDSKNVGGADDRERAKFWEVWDKNNKRVVWVAQGCEDILDEADPHVELQNFFPCPKPAYGTVQRGSLIPVPDAMQYKDQLDEINLLTGRIHALSAAVQAKGFYPGGSGEAAEAIQTALKLNTPGELLVPINNWSTFGGTKEPILWMPIDMYAQVITALVALRKQVIEDIYQIMGLSDIMRGATDPNETLGAQQLKTQYGSTRIRDKQQEMVRLARDLVEITSEIITEKFSEKTMIQMSQTQLPTKQMQERKARELDQQLEQMRWTVQELQRRQGPQPPQMGDNGGPPMDPAAQAAQQLAQAEQQIAAEHEKLKQEPTTDQVFRFLQDSRAKSFVLDIETDSTILADENAEKQRRTEFVGMLGTLLPQLAQMIQTDPKNAPFCGDVLKFSTGAFRAGRSLEGSIDELVEHAKEQGEGERPDDPQTAQGKIALQIEQMKIASQDKKNQADLQLKQQEMAQKDAHKQQELANDRAIKLAELQAKQRDRQQEMVQANQDQMSERENHQMDLLGKQQDMHLNQQKADIAIRAHQLKASDIAARQGERAAAAQFRQQNAMNKQQPV